MKFTTLSVLTALALTATTASALTLYQDTATGQVFTKGGDGRVMMGDFVDAKTVYMENQAQDSAFAKNDIKKKKQVPVFSKASKLKLSGTHYLGYTMKDKDEKQGGSDSKFETRRNYLQVKAYFFDDPKSYMRMTLDTFENNTDASATNDGSTEVRLKYGYIYLNNILPYTGVEFGQVHRPWIDYEEHNAYAYRSISKTFVEASEGAHLTNSADKGINFKTKTAYFSSEVGIFNGEGYHSHEDGEGNSLEWRATAHLLGKGRSQKDHWTEETYWNVSTFGQYNMDMANNAGKNSDGSAATGQTYTMLGFHTVYNQPEFLVSAQYITTDTTDEGKAKNGAYAYEGDGYSLAGAYRFGADLKWDVFARYDAWTKDGTATGADIDSEYAILGTGYQYNKNVKFLLNGLYTEPNKDVSDDDYFTYMFTAEVNW